MANENKNNVAGKVSIAIKTNLAILISTVTFISTGYLYIDSKYALASDVEDNKKEIRTIKIQNTYEKSLNNMYSYRSLSKKYPSDEKLKEELKKAEEEVNFIKKQLEKKQLEKE